MNSSNSWRVSNMSSCPKLRIEGFTDAWEQRKLGDVFKEYSEKNHLELPPLTIIQGKGTILREESDRNLQYDKANLAGYKLVRKNDLIVHLRSFEGGLERANTDGIVSPAYHMFHGDNTDTRFYYPFFRSKHFIDSLLKPHVYGIRDGKSIDIEGMKTIIIPVPSYEEQRRIGDFIESMDNLITLHQRKSDALKNAKKYFLKNMFPSEGEKFPKLRLEGFTDAWEQRKLKDMASFIRGSFPQPYTNPDFYDENGGKPFVQVADIGMGLELNQDTKTHISRIAESKSRFVEAGTVIVALQGSIETSIGRTAITQYDAFVDRTILIFESYRIPIDKIFFAQSIKKLFQKEKEKAWGATISTITKEHLSDFILGIPSLDEQVKIGLFFKNIDNLITLHQRKCDALKNAKKFFLQNMFV